MIQAFLKDKGKVTAFLLAFVLILLGVASRFLPHPFNFTPIAAIAIFAGANFSKKTALLLPLLIMLISDVFLGFYEIPVMIAVYGSFLLCTFLGQWVGKTKKWQKILGSSLAASIIFFLTTNFAVWAFTPWYEKSAGGLIYAYIMGLPFFRNMILGDIIYVSLFFGLYEIIYASIMKKLQLYATKES